MPSCRARPRTLGKAWDNTTRRFDVSGAREAGGCPCCVEGRLEYLAGEAASAAITLCGRNAVQITPSDRGGELDLARLAGRLGAHGKFSHNGYLLHGSLDASDGGGPYELTVFPDGRAIIKGTTEPETARSLYARYVGS